MVYTLYNTFHMFRMDSASRHGINQRALVRACSIVNLLIGFFDFDSTIVVILTHDLPNPSLPAPR